MPPISSPKISIITAVRNGADTISSAIDSVAAQTYPHLEHLIIDGMSSDGTFDFVQQSSSPYLKSYQEPDEGIYDALNKGIEKATGDIIAILHADDLLADSQVMEHVANRFVQQDIDAVYGDLVYVKQQNTESIIRYWRARAYHPNRFHRGWMPPHPTFSLRKSCYQKLGNYRTDIGTAADYELLLRMLYVHRVNVAYIPKVLVKMRVGGASNANLSNRLKANQADRFAWLENDLKPPFGLRISKPLRKIPQFFIRPPKS